MTYFFNKNITLNWSHMHEGIDYPTTFWDGPHILQLCLHSHGEAIFSNILNLVSVARSIPGGTSLWPPCFFVRLMTGVPRGIEPPTARGSNRQQRSRWFHSSSSKLVWIRFLCVEAVKDNIGEIWWRSLHYRANVTQTDVVDGQYMSM